MSTGVIPAGKSTRAAGFTLIEVLIAVTLLGVIMVLLFSGLRLAGRSWDSGESRSRELSNQVMVSGFLRQYISTALPLTDDFTVEEGEEPLFTFMGRESALQFVSTLPSYRGRGGLHFFYLRLEEPEDSQQKGMNLVLTLWPFFPMFEGMAAPIEDLVLLRGVEALTLHYYGLEEGEEDMQWLDEWQDKRVLPEVVQIDFEFVDGQYWPPMFVRPQIDQRAS